MTVTSTRAALARNRELDPESTLTATLPREEVEAALAEAEPPELVLDVLRRIDGEVEKHAVSVEWDRADLEGLLDETGERTITLAFDAAELERSLASGEVEAHGIREKALVLTVAVAAAAGGASSTSASLQEGVTSAGGGQPAIVASHDEATLAARGIEQPVAASHDEASLAARGIGPAVAASHDEATLAARGIGPAIAASHDEVGLASRGIPVPAPAPERSAAGAPAIEPATVAAIGITGAAGLMIAAAAFALRRQRPPSPA